MKIERLANGLVVYDVFRHKMGNTNITTVAVRDVRIHSVDVEKRLVKASINGNSIRKYTEHNWSKWRLKEPKLVKCGIGYRLARRGET